MSADLLARLDASAARRRCSCPSCENGYENHSHSCVDGRGCVETRDRLRAALVTLRWFIAEAASEIRGLRARLAALVAENAAGGGI